MVGSPNDFMRMPGIPICRHLVAALCSQQVIKGSCVHRAMKYSWFVSHMFHDINFSRSRPRTIHLIGGKHPCRGPCTETGPIGQSGSNLHSTRRPVSEPFGLDPCRGIVVPSVRFSDSSNIQDSILDERISHTIGVVLKLVIAPTPSSDIIGPFGRVWNPIDGKFIGP